MKNVIKIAAVALTLAASNVALAGQPVGAALVSTKVAHKAALSTSAPAGKSIASNQIKSFQWGSTPASTQAATQRVVTAANLAAKPSVITWPDTTGSTKSRPVRRGGRR